MRVYAKKQKIKKQEGDLAVLAVFYTGGVGDTDNLVKSLLDGLNGVAWDDDRQVKMLVGIKESYPKGEERTEVWIGRAEEIKPKLISLLEGIVCA